MKGFGRKLEGIVIGGLALIFVIWAASKCNSARRAGHAQTQKETPKSDNLTISDTTAKIAEQNPPAPPVAAPGIDPNADLARLFVVIDKLKLRKGPGLKKEVLAELSLYEQVYFLNEMTDSSYEINLGKMVVQEPYLKVRTKKGLEGWVYGAGISYLRKKHPGTLE